MASDPASGRIHRVTLPLADVSIDAVTADEAAEFLFARLREGRGGTVVTPNVDHLHKLRRQPALREAYDDADLVLADGMPLVWASRLLRTPLPERVAGSHLFPLLTELAARHGRSIFILGGSPGAADAAARTARARWPELAVVGVACPPFGFDADPAMVDAVCRQVVDAGPDLVFTALGAPKQERLNLRLHQALPTAWFLGVGAAVDMAAGNVTRAPLWAQRLGLEWVVRLVQEPGRMARRYLIDDLPFAIRLLAVSAYRGRLRRRPR